MVSMKALGHGSAGSRQGPHLWCFSFTQLGLQVFLNLIRGEKSSREPGRVPRALCPADPAPNPPELAPDVD